MSFIYYSLGLVSLHLLPLLCVPILCSCHTALGFAPCCSRRQALLRLPLHSAQLAHPSCAPRCTMWLAFSAVTMHRLCCFLFHLRRAAIREMLDTEGPYLLDVMVPHIQVGSCVCCPPLLLKHRLYGGYQVVWLGAAAMVPHIQVGIPTKPELFLALSTAGGALRACCACLA